MEPRPEWTEGMDAQAWTEGMDGPAWTEGVDEPALAVIGANNLSKMARRAELITEEVTRIKQRVDRMIQTFERAQGLQAGVHSPGMEIFDDMDELENILTDNLQKKRYQQKLTVFIVGYQEVCGQRSHLLAQLQEFFSIYSKLSEEDGDLTQPEDALVDLDGVAAQVTGALRSAEVAMSRLADIHTGIMSCVSQTLLAGAPRKRKIPDDKNRKRLEKTVEQAREDIGKLTDQLLKAQEEITSRDKQLKDQMKQNEARMLEVHHFKGQLEATKRSLQALQEESGKQCSLLEAELRRQACRLAELESQATAKWDQRRDASSQWEIQNDFSEEEVVTIHDEEEDGGIQNQCPLTEKEGPLEPVDDAGDGQRYNMELSVDNSNVSAIKSMSVPEMEENIDNTTPLDLSTENVSIITSSVSDVITSLPAKEDGESIFISLPVSEESQTIFATLSSTSEVNKSIITSHAEFKENISTITPLPLPGQMIYSKASLPLYEEKNSSNTLITVPEDTINVPEQAVSKVIFNSIRSLPDYEKISEPKSFPYQAFEDKVICKELEDYSLSTSAATKEEHQVQTGWMLQGEEQHSLSGDAKGELWGTSHRLHVCIQAIRNLLITGGFHSLAKMLSSEDQKLNGDAIYENLTLIENVPAVLHSLIERLSLSGEEDKLSAGAGSQGGDDTTGIKRPKEASGTLLDTNPKIETCGCTQHSTHTPLHNTTRGCLLHTLIFTRQDEEHNRRVLQRAVYQGRIPIHQYKVRKCPSHNLLHLQEASGAMSEYRNLITERLQSLIKGYRLNVSWNQAETLVRRQSHQKLQVMPILTKLQEQKQQALLRWKQERVRSWERRLHLSISLDKTLRDVQEESGIFLIKPILSWPGRSKVLKTHRQIQSNSKVVPKSNKLPIYHVTQQDYLLYRGRTTGPVTQEWSVLQNHGELKPLVITPKMQEMDVNGYLFKECRVMSQPLDTSTGTFQKVASSLQSFLRVRRTCPFPAL
ncbi:uncharacterized protein O3C94_008593 [Discoglossus pictus]